MVGIAHSNGSFYSYEECVIDKYSTKLEVGGEVLTDNQIKVDKKNRIDNRSYHKTKMQKDMIIQRLKDSGCRITNQRLLIIDIILQDECSCCKEIYYKASHIDNSIGAATIYRFVNTLEEIGAINRKNMYKVAFSKDCAMEDACIVVLDDKTVYNLSAQKWNTIIKAGLTSLGYLENQNIASVSVIQCQCEGGEC